jgi:PAS domain S-box-containing protein
VVLVLTGIVPIVALMVVSNLDQRRQALETVGAEATRLAGLAALREADLVDGGREVLAAVAQLRSVQSRDSSACDAQLQALLPLYTRFANIGVVAPNGDLFCSGIAPSSPQNYSDRAWFRRAVSSRRFAVGDYQVGRITGLPSLVMGLPMFDQAGALRGVAWAALDLSWLNRFAARVKLPGRQALVLIDRQGTVLSRYPDPERWEGKKFPGATKAIAKAGGPPFEANGVDGVRRLYAFSALGGVDDPHALVGVGITTADAYTAANRALHRSLGLLAGITLLGLLIARIVANRLIVQPTATLVDASRRLAVGDLGSRIGPPYGSGELGQLSRAFDDMASALEARDAALLCAIEEREQSEARFKASQEQLQAILDNAPASISMKDDQGRYVLVNRHFERIWKVSRADIVGRTPEEVLGPEAGRVVMARDKRVIDGRVPVEVEEEYVLDDGPHTYLSFVFPLSDASGVPYALCGIATDITERIQAQADREALEAQLQQAQRLESLGQLAGGVAHDFNNLLAVILNYADFVLDALPDEAPEDWPEVVEGIRADMGAIRQAGEAAAALTRQLLIFGRRDTVQARVLDLREVVTRVEPLLRRTLGEHLSLRFFLPTDLRPIRADAGRLEQVLVNLAVNARDAMEAGGTLTISAANVDIDRDEAVRLSLPSGAYVRLEVADTGVGMPPDVADRAFEPFFTTKQKGHGTGLGLATVFGIVTEAGGAVSIHSVPGRGTTVRTHFPAVAAEPPEEDDFDDEEIPAARSATVLVVEDEDPVREVARRILTAEGYQVLCAADPLDALRLCQDDACTIDLVLTDVVMPGFSGPELMEKVRRFRPDIRALYMSGYPEDLLVHRHRFDEDVEVIGKPFTADSLLRMVGLALDQP